jgi:hypothetical protein
VTIAPHSELDDRELIRRMVVMPSAINFGIGGSHAKV